MADDASASSSALSASGDGGASSGDGGASSAGGRSVLGRVGRVAAYALAGLLALVLGLLLFLQTETGATATARFLVERFNPLDGTSIEIGSAGGSWVGSLELRDVRLTRPDTSAAGRGALADDAPTGATVMARADTVRASYDLGALLGRELQIGDALVSGLRFDARRAADSTWDWQRVLPESEPDTSASSFGVQIGALTVRDARARVEFAPGGTRPGGRDSTLVVHDLGGTLRDFRTQPSLQGAVDGLRLEATPPGLDSTAGRLTLRADGGFDGRTVALDRLRLDSPRSQVRGSGTLALAGPDSPDSTDVLAPGTDLRLRADPLSLRDVAPFVPNLRLDPTASLALDARITADEDGAIEATLDASTSEGGTVRLDASVTPAPADSVRYRLSANVDSLDPSALTLDNALALGPLTGTVEGDLRGPSLDRLSGPLDVRLRDTEAFGYRTERADLGVTFDDGEAGVTLDGRLARRAPLSGLLSETGLRLRGTVRPLGDTLRYDLRAPLDSLNLAAFASGPPSRLDGTLRLEGRGTDPQTATATARLDLRRSRVANRVIDDADVTARLADGTLRFDLTLDLPEGRLVTGGRVTLPSNGAPITYALTEGRLEDVDLARLAGAQDLPSRFDARFDLDGRGTDPQRLRLTANARAKGTYGSHRLDTLDVRASLDGGALGGRVAATLDDGRLAFDLGGRPFGTPPALAVTNGQLDGFDVAAVLLDTTQTTDLNGSFRAEVRGADPQTMRLEADLALDDSRINREQIDRARLVARLARGEAEAQVELDTPEGGADLALVAQPFAERPRAHVTEGRFERLDVGELAGLTGLRTVLDGQVTLEAAGYDDPSRLTLDAAIDLNDGARLNDAVFDDAQLTARLDDGAGTIEGRGRLRSGGAFTLDVSVRDLGTAPALDLTARLDTLNVGALAGLKRPASVSIQAQADGSSTAALGEGLGLETLRLRGRATSTQGRLAGARLDTLALDFRLARGLLVVDTLRVASNVARATGGGRLALLPQPAADVPLPPDSLGANGGAEADTTAESDFILRVEADSLQPLAALVGAQTLSLGDGRVALRAYGPARALRFDGQAQIDDLVYDDYRLGTFEARMSGLRDADGTLRQAAARGEATYLASSGITADSLRFRTVYDGDTLTVRPLRVRLDKQRAATLRATLDPRPGRQRLLLSDVRLTFGKDRWRLVQPATVRYGDAYRVSTLLLATEDQQIAADGVIDFNGQQSLVVTIEQFEMGAVADLAGLEGLGGRLSGSVSLDGPASAPQMTGDLNLDLRSGGEAVGRLDLTARYDSLRLALDAVLTDDRARTLTAEGRIPLDLRLQAADSADVLGAPVELGLRTESFSVGWVDPFLPPELLQDPDGQLIADVRVRGTRAAPELSGTAQFRQAAITVPQVGARYRSLDADLSFSGDDIRIDRATARSQGGGTARVTGTVNLAELTLGEFDLDVQADNFQAVDMEREYQARTDASLRVRGTTDQPRVTGDVQVVSGDFYADVSSGASVAEVALSADDIRTLERRFGIRLRAADTTSTDAYDALALDVRLQIERNVWLRRESNPEMDIQFTGQLDVQKDPGGDLQAFGTIEVIPERSRLVQFGRVFEIEEGTLAFNGPVADPRLDITAVYEPRVAPTRGGRGAGSGVRILLSVDGRPEDPSLALNAEPPMEQSDIFCYIATNSPCGAFTEGGGSGFSGGELASDVALGQATSLVEGLVTEGVGVDIFRIQERPSSGAFYLVVGEYLTPRLFVSVEQPLTQGDASDAQARDSQIPDVTLEYEIQRWLLLRTLRRQNTLSLNFLLEYGY